MQATLAGARILVVEARFYDDIADALLAGAAKALDEARRACDIVTVPGSLEIAAGHRDRARRRREAEQALRRRGRRSAA